MRIISGKNKGRKIQAPKNLPVRPTTDKAKEALFNIIGNKYIEIIYQPEYEDTGVPWSLIKSMFLKMKGY